MLDMPLEVIEFGFMTNLEECFNPSYAGYASGSNIVPFTSIVN